MKTVAVIPTYNAEQSIGKIVKDCKRYVNKVIVVDNNSKDKSAVIAYRSGADVIGQPIQGQGAATRLGWQFTKDYDVVVTLDSDGQHDPAEIVNVMMPVVNGQVDISVGSRFINGYKAPKYRKFGIDVINLVYNFGHKEKLIDTQSCFRAYSKEALNKIQIEENGFTFSTEILLKARKQNLRVTEVPIKCIYHDSLKSNSTMNPVKHGLGVAIKTLIWRIKLWN